MHHSCFNLLRFTICQFNTTGCNDLYCLARLHHSAFTPENLTTLAHFSVSSAMSLPNSAGESASPTSPRSASRALILGSASAALISLLSLSMISSGVSRGAPTPYHVLASNPGTKSPTGGTSGNASERIAVVTASARSLPALTCSIEDGIGSNVTCIC